MGEFFDADCKSLLVQFTHQEKQLKLKRRWLAGLPLSRDELRQFKGPNSENDRAIPESLLREDDVYYETVKSFVEKILVKCNNAQSEGVVQHDVQYFPSHDNKETILHLLDDMTNIALCNFAEILIGGSMKFKKTRSKMKKIIKEFLPKILNNKNVNYNSDIYTQICQLLKDPQNFRRTLDTSESDQSHHDAALKILNRLEDFPTQALTAMHRRLIGIKGYVPELKPPTKQGLRRDVLIQKVRELCTEMLTELDDGDDELLQEPLAEAMVVGSSTLKLLLGCDIVTDFKFKRVSPDVEFFQNEVAKAICLLNQKGRFDEIKNLKVLLDPNAKLTNKKLRLAVKRLLTEYLFECDDLQNIPRWLLQTLAIVNKSSQSSCRMEEMQESSISRDVEEEVECILSVSALTRQVVWDLFPDYGFDFDFSDAYMEDLEESDDGENCEDEVKNIGGFCSYESKDQTESIGEINPTMVFMVSSAPRTERDDCSPFLESNGRPKVKLEPVEFKLESMDDAVEMDAVDSYPSTSSSSCLDSKDVDFHSYTADFSAHGKLNKNYAKSPGPSMDIEKSHDSGTCNISSGEVNFMNDEQSVIRNKYLVIQEASDETSMVAYRLIGRLLENFAQGDGLDLDDGAVSYLRDSDQIPRSSKEDDCDSVIFQAVEELIPSFPKSGRERLNQLLGLNPNFVS